MVLVLFHGRPEPCSRLVGIGSAIEDMVQGQVVTSHHTHILGFLLELQGELANALRERAKAGEVSGLPHGVTLTAIDV